MKRSTLSAALVGAGAALLAACNFAPPYVRPDPQPFVPPAWPEGAAYPPAEDGAAGLPWRELITDDRLRRVVQQALDHNQDLAVAVANVASARAQYRVQRSYQLPTLAASAGANVQRFGRDGGAFDGANGVSGATGAGSATEYTGSLGISAFELDLFGRVRNLSRAALEQYLATESGARATRFSVVSETATAFVTLAADRDLLATAREQVSSSQRTVVLNRDLHDRGLVSGSDVADAETVLAQARSDVEGYTTQVAQDQNALTLLVGQPVAEADLPPSLGALEPGLHAPPAGLSSSILLARPDVVEAEHQLKATNYDIGAARAAFFPTISLTAALGFATSSLSSLFAPESNYWLLAPALSVPLLGGPTRGNLDYAKAQREYYLATYRKTIQSAFRDVADALARRGTIDRQRQAQADLVNAARRSYTIAEARYRAGVDSFLNTLVSQRTLYAAQRTAVAIQLADLTNRVTLYEALGADPTL